MKDFASPNAQYFQNIVFMLYIAPGICYNLDIKAEFLPLEAVLSEKKDRDTGRDRRHSLL
jgi:hypothetical protein